MKETEILLTIIVNFLLKELSKKLCGETVIREVIFKQNLGVKDENCRTGKALKDTVKGMESADLNTHMFYR